MQQLTYGNRHSSAHSNSHATRTEIQQVEYSTEAHIQLRFGRCPHDDSLAVVAVQVLSTRLGSSVHLGRSGMSCSATGFSMSCSATRFGDVLASDACIPHIALQSSCRWHFSQAVDSMLTLITRISCSHTPCLHMSIWFALWLNNLAFIATSSLIQCLSLAQNLLVMPELDPKPTRRRPYHTRAHRC